MFRERWVFHWKTSDLIDSIDSNIECLIEREDKLWERYDSASSFLSRMGYSVDGGNVTGTGEFFEDEKNNLHFLTGEDGRQYLERGVTQSYVQKVLRQVCDVWREIEEVKKQELEYDAWYRFLQRNLGTEGDSVLYLDYDDCLYFNL